MKPGTKPLKALLVAWTLSLFLCHVYALQAEEITRETNQKKTQDAETRKNVLKKKAYYHFFLEDYLSAATDLKLLEGDAKTEGDIMTLNESRRLLGSLYLAWGMDRSATRVFKALIEVTSEGQEKTGLFKIVQKMQYDRTLYQAAIETYALFAAEKESPGMDQAVYLAGMSHYEKGSVQKGIDLLSSLKPESRYFPYAQLTLAKSRFLLNHLSESLQLFQKSSAFNPYGDPLLQALAEKSRLSWGQVLMEEERYQEAGKVLALISPESPFYSDALFSRGWAAFKNENEQKALALFQALIQVDPEQPYALEAMTHIGHGYRRMGAYSSAMEQYSNALALYAKEEKKLMDAQIRVQDLVRLAVLLESDPRPENQSEEKKDLLAKLIAGDDGLPFWIGQYKGLSSLSAYLDQKRRDMRVFQVMVDHREAVFRQALPSLESFFATQPFSQLRQQERTLKLRVDQAIRSENLMALARPQEEKTLRQLAKAQQRSSTLGKRITALEAFTADSSASERLVALNEEWRNLDRILKIAVGEWTWKMATALPGKVDDLMQTLRRLHAERLEVEERSMRLNRSVPTLDTEMARFQIRIESAQTRLSTLHQKTLRLKERLLPALQALFLKHLKRKLNQLHAWMAAAELSQIQVLDVINAGGN